jgi:hypothetical protein
MVSSEASGHLLVEYRTVLVPRWVCARRGALPTGRTMRQAVADASARTGQGDVETLDVGVADNVVAAIEPRAGELDRCLVCMATHGRGRVAGP